jgi:folate-dependent phosphoribosylglycinamide formyltransferase PurN
MRIAFLCDDEPFHIPGTVSNVIEARPEHDYTIISVPGHGSFSKLGTNFRRYLGLYGPLGFPLRAVQFLALKLGAAIGLPTTRPHSLRQAARRNGVRYLKLDSINSKSGRKILRDLEPDVFFSIACPQILKSRTLAIPRLGVYNIHTSMLPENRGMLPSFWTLFEDRGKTGVTLHKMNEQLDAGPILLQKRIPARISDTSLHQLIALGKRTAAELLIQAVDIMESGEVELHPNNPDEATTNTFPQREDVLEFRRRGGRIW